jgi:hypothetical protein
LRPFCGLEAVLVLGEFAGAGSPIAIQDPDQEKQSDFHVAAPGEFEAAREVVEVNLTGV